MFYNRQYRYFEQCYGFSERQLQIIKLLFDGLDNETIAKRLKIRYKTVKAHFGHIYKRVGVEDKAQLIIQLSQVARTRIKSKKR